MLILVDSSAMLGMTVVPDADLWGTQEGELNWYVLCDLWEDDVIDIGDLSAFVEDWMWQADWAN